MAVEENVSLTPAEFVDLWSTFAGVLDVQEFLESVASRYRIERVTVAFATQALVDEPAMPERARWYLAIAGRQRCRQLLAAYMKEATGGARAALN